MPYLSQARRFIGGHPGAPSAASRVLSSLSRAANSRIGRYAIKKTTNYLTKRLDRINKHNRRVRNTLGERDVPPKKKVEASDFHSAGDTKSLRVVLNKPKKSHLKSPLVEYYGYSEKINGQAGLQTCNYWVNGGTTDHFVLNGSGVFGPPVAYFAMNPNQKITGSEDVSTNVIWHAGQDPRSDKITMTRSTYMIDICNFSTAVMYGTVYVVVCKKKTDISALAAWAEGLAEQQDGVYTAEVPQPALPGPASIGFPLISHVGIRPNQSRRFRELWKIKKAFKITLGGGSNQKINIVVEKNKSYTKEYIQTCRQDGDRYMPGFVGVFCVANSQPVYDQTTTPRVTYGFVDYGFICNVRDEMIPGSYQKRSKMNLAITTYPVGASGTNLQQIDNEDTLITQIGL